MHLKFIIIMNDNRVNCGNPHWKNIVWIYRASKQPEIPTIPTIGFRTRAHNTVIMIVSLNRTKKKKILVNLRFLRKLNTQSEHVITPLVVLTRPNTGA